MTKKPTAQPQDKYVLRMPDGLRDRIKAYAERVGTSMNYEIVRVLEREWPEQWPISRRLQELAQSLSVLAAGKSDPNVQRFLSDFEETVTGIITGRVIGVDAETRDAVEDLWKDYQARRAEAESDAYEEPDFSEEERRALEIVGRPEKYAVPPPERAEPWRDVSYLTDVFPRYELAEFTKHISAGDIEGAKRVLDSLPRDKLLKQIEYANMTLFERIERDLKLNATPDDDPFGFDNK